MLAEQAGVEFVDIGVVSLDRRAAQLLTREEADELRAIPIRVHPDDSVSVAVADPTGETLLPRLELALGGSRLRLLVTTQSALRAAVAATHPQPV